MKDFKEILEIFIKIMAFIALALLNTLFISMIVAIYMNCGG